MPVIDGVTVDSKNIATVPVIVPIAKSNTIISGTANILPDVEQQTPPTVPELDNAKVLARKAEKTA